MKRGLSNKLKLLFAGFAMVLGVATSVSGKRAENVNAEKTAYSVVFDKGTDDSSTAGPSIKSGSDCMTITAKSYAYKRTNGMHLSSSKNAGSATLTATTKGQVVATKVVVNALAKDSKSFEVTVTYADDTTEDSIFTPGTTSVNNTLTLSNTTKKLKSIDFYCAKSTGVGIASITVYVAGEEDPTYNINYLANDGGDGTSVSGLPTAGESTDGTFTLDSTTKPTRDGYEFLGWGASSSATANDLITEVTVDGADVNVYAIWKDLSTLPNCSKVLTGMTAGNYVIASTNNYALTNSLNGTRFNNTSVTITNDKIYEPDNSIIWKAQAVDTYWTFYNVTAGKYLGSTSTKNTGALLDSVTDYAKWTITDDEAGNFTFENLGRSGGSDSGNKYLRNNDSTGWAAYSSSTGKGPMLFKKASTGTETYLVTYDANGATSGTAPTDSNSYEKGATVTILGNTGSLAKTGLSFLGWNTKNDGTGTNYSANDTFTMDELDVKLYANWGVTSSKESPLTVAQAKAAIDAMGSTAISEAYVKGTVSQVDKYNETYKSIQYWISDDGTTTDQLECYSGKGLNGADFAAIGDVEVGDVYIVKGSLKLYGTTYEFDKNNEIVVKYLKAKFALDGGEGTFANITGKLAGDKFNLPTDLPTKAHYTFGGWSDGTNVYQAGAEYTMGSADVTFTATWNEIKHSVTYSIGEGTGTVPTQADVAETASFNAAAYDGITRDGYKLVGWNDGTTTYVAGQSITMGTANISLSAVWAKTYTVTYVSNGATGDVPSVSTYIEGDKVTVCDATGLTKAHHVFAGWSDGTNTYQAGAEITVGTANITLTAQWDKAQYTVTATYNNVTGTVTSSTKVEYESSVVDTLTADQGYALPTKVSVTVGSTTKDVNIVDDVLTIANVDGNVSYTVNAIKLFTVTGTIENGSLTGANEVMPGVAYSATVTPSEGYVAADSIKVTVGGTEITTGFAYSNGAVTIAAEAVTGDIVITADCYKVFTVTTNVTNGSYSGASSIKSNGTAEITISATGDYILPAQGDFTVTGASIVSYTNGVLVIGNATDNVVISVSCPEVPLCDVSVNMTHVIATGTGFDVVRYGENTSVVISADAGYILPAQADFTVTGATAGFAFNADNTSVTITLSNVTGDVAINASAIKKCSVGVTVTNGTASVGSQAFIAGGTTFNSVFTPNAGYKLPASIAVKVNGTLVTSGYSYNASTGAFSMVINGDVTIEVAMAVIEVYTVTLNLTNMDKVSGAATITEKTTEEYVIAPKSGYGMPNDVTVTGATKKSFDKATGKVVISNPTANVTITAVADNDAVVSITLSESSGSFKYGQAFAKPTVTAHYKYSADKDVTASAKVTGYNPNTIKDQVVTISYTEGGVTVNATYNVKMIRVIQRVEIKDYAPDVYLNEEYKFNGKVYVYFTDAPKQAVEAKIGYEVEKVDTSKLGETKLRVSVNGVSTEVTIKVFERPAEIKSVGGKAAAGVAAVAVPVGLAVGLFFLLKFIKL